MKKKKIRCFKTLAHVAPNVYNYPVFFMGYEGWSNFSLETCTNCGELFVIDWENPATKGLTITDIVSIKKCPTCNFLLKDTIQDYPKVVKLSNGLFGSYIPENYIPPDEESIIRKFFEIIPEKNKTI